jgi:hypothetical protein
MIFDFEPDYYKNGIKTTSSTFLKIFVKDRFSQKLVTAVMSSTVFNWFWFLYSDNYHLTKIDIKRFKIKPVNNSKVIEEKIFFLVSQLMSDLLNNSITKKTYYKSQGEIIYKEFYPRKSKPIIDEIDTVLAEHYGFTEEELDFIINYDIKYRMGKQNEEDE